MVRVAIVEDDDKERALLQGYLLNYGKEYNVAFTIETYENAIDFLEKYGNGYDIVFMDIELPYIDGLAAAKKLRDRDRTVTLIFTTNMAQFAINGYEVEAFDFIVKPVIYNDFVFRIEKVISRLSRMTQRFISINLTRGDCMKLDVSHIKYVEIMDHAITYHCDEGDYTAYGTLKKVENTLDRESFVRCNSCYLVNLKYVTNVHDLVCEVGGRQLKISQTKKKDFMKALNDYISGGLDV